MFSFKTSDSMMTFEGEKFQGKDAIIKKIVVSYNIKLFKVFLYILDCHVAKGNLSEIRIWQLLVNRSKCINSNQVGVFLCLCVECGKGT